MNKALRLGTGIETVYYMPNDVGRN